MQFMQIAVYICSKPFNLCYFKVSLDIKNLLLIKSD